MTASIHIRSYRYHIILIGLEKLEPLKITNKGHICYVCHNLQERCLIKPQSLYLPKLKKKKKNRLNQLLVERPQRESSPSCQSFYSEHPISMSSEPSFSPSKYKPNYPLSHFHLLFNHGFIGL
jgi:hypothetical protein